MGQAYPLLEKGPLRGLWGFLYHPVSKKLQLEFDSLVEAGLIFHWTHKVVVI